ncbi:MAG: hypothetical protein M1828_004895 [Chrysothrix sp. TS-e1954]|nr:MAG: hypothetical protein M1828_004895 [Chrysothrix sp. TS-e1954]
MAKKTNTVVVVPEEMNSIYLRDGKHITGHEADQLWGAIWQIIDEGFDYSKEHGVEINEKESLLDWMKEKVGKLSIDEDHKDRIMQLASAWGAFVGDSIATQSLKNLWLEAGLEGGQSAQRAFYLHVYHADQLQDTLFVASSYKAMLDYVAEPVVRDAHIRFSTEVLQIKTLNAGSQDHKGVEILSSRGKSTTFDQVIVTSPLGYLQKHKHIFNPPMPDSLSNAVDAIHYGHLEKVYIKFPEAWWEPSPSDTSPDAPKPYRGHIWTTPSYAHGTNPKSWTQQCILYSAFPSPARQPVLLFYIFGANAAHITNLLHNPDADRNDVDMFNDLLSPPHPPRSRSEILTSFFHPYYSKLPNYSPTSPICKPTGILPTDWSHDRLAGNGSYTNYQVGLEDGKAALDTIRAGEHAAPYVALGTVVGAYWSGERIARQIAAQYGLGKGLEVEQEGLGEEAVAPREAKTNLVREGRGDGEGQLN